MLANRSRSPRLGSFGVLALLSTALCFSAPAPAQEGGVNRTLLRVPELDKQEQERRRPHISKAAEWVRDSVVHVYCKFERQGRTPAGGSRFVKVERPSSGAILSKDGLVVTSWHLVREAVDEAGRPSATYQLEVQLRNGKVLPAKIVAKDTRLDLALLKVDPIEGVELQPIELGGTDAVPPGTRMVSLGFVDEAKAWAFTGCLAEPSGDALLGEATIRKDEFYVTDSGMTPNTDGGPVVDVRGVMVALTNSRHLTEPKSEPKLEDFLQPDYTVLIRASSIRKAFGSELRGLASRRLQAGPELRPQLLAKYREAIVGVFAGDPTKLPKAPKPTDPRARRRVPRMGSGVVIDPRGLIVTNAHLVIGSRNDIRITHVGGKTREAELLEHDSEKNIALLRVPLAADEKLVAIPAGVSSTGIPGEEVLIAGNPLGHTLSVSAGILSSVRQRSGRLQLNARIDGSVTGGAVIDVSGRLLGIADAGSRDRFPVGRETPRESGLGSATGIDEVRRQFRDALAKYAVSEELHAKPEIPEAERALRKGPVADVVARTRDSLLNIFIRVKVQRKPQGFSPFGDDEGMFLSRGAGSGVIIGSDGLAITNWHVVDAATQRGGAQRDDHKVSVSLPNGKVYDARVLSTSRDDDLALIKLQLDDGETVTPVELADSDALFSGESVLAIGNPYGQRNTVTTGVIACTGVDRHIKNRVRIFRNLLQTDAAINPGNSGGALLDMNGRLVGINSAGSGWTTGRGLAIPVNHVRKTFRNKLISAERLRSAFVGVLAGDVDGKVVLTNVNPYGPGARAGMKSGDELVSLGGTKLASSLDLPGILLSLPALKPCKAVVRRGSETKTLDLVPIPSSIWRVFRQTGIEVTPVSYREESELVRKGSIALHRAYTGNHSAVPTELMSGALRVVQVHPAEGERGLKLDAGDLLLGISLVYEGLEMDRTELLRFETIERAARSFEQLATLDGRDVQAFVLRKNGDVERVNLVVRKAYQR